MRRRDVMTFLGGAAVWPLAARAQQAGNSHRIAWVHPSAPLADMNEVSGARSYHGFFDELRVLGHVEGVNLILERYSGEGRPAHFDEVVRAAVQSAPELIFTSGAEMTRRLQAATRTIPTVALLTDPVTTGFVANLAHPGGNLTGVAIDAGIEIWGKRLALLKEAVPSASRIGFLSSHAYWENAERSGAASRAAAQQLGITLIGCLSGASEQEYRALFAAMPNDRLDALVVSEETENFINRKLVIELAQKNALPVIYPYREYVELGGLFGYTVDLADIFRQAVRQIDRILKGASPADLPFQQQTKFELIVNLKTAKALGLDLAPMLLGRADQVIE